MTTGIDALLLCRAVVLSYFPWMLERVHHPLDVKQLMDRVLKLIVDPCSYLCRYKRPRRKRWRAKSGKSSGRAQPWLNGRKKLSWISGALARQTDGDSIGRSLLPSFALTCLFSNSYFPSPLYLSASLLSFMHFSPPSLLLHFSSFFSRAACHPPSNLQSGGSTSVLPVCIIKSTNHRENVSQRILSPQRAKM